MNKKKIIIILGIIMIVAIAITFFVKSNYKNLKIGNNIINKSISDVEEYILNISSYEAEIEVTVESNKNENKYRLRQKYNNENVAKQEVIEPSNIQGLETIYRDQKLEIKNSKLGLSTILENYPYMTQNILWLSTFIHEYKESDEKTINKENNEYVMEVKVKEANKYSCNKKLYIDTTTNKPTKMLIQDKNNKTLVYILYKEIKLDSLSRDDVLAFKLEEIYLKGL